jgi:hypothetical protein
LHYAKKMYGKVEVHPHTFLNFTTETGEHTVPRLPVESAPLQNEDACALELGFMLLRKDVVSA